MVEDPQNITSRELWIGEIHGKPIVAYPPSVSEDRQPEGGRIRLSSVYMPNGLCAYPLIEPNGSALKELF